MAAASASFTIVLGKAASTTIPSSLHAPTVAPPETASSALHSPALPVCPHRLSRACNRGLRSPGAPCVVGINRSHISGVRAAPTLWPSPSQTTPLPLLSSELIWTRVHRRQAATSCKSQATVVYGSDHSNTAPPPPPPPITPLCTEIATATHQLLFWWFILALHGSYPYRSDPARHRFGKKKLRPCSACSPPEAPVDASIPAAFPEVLTLVEIKVFEWSSDARTSTRRINSAPDWPVIPSFSTSAFSLENPSIVRNGFLLLYIFRPTRAPRCRMCPL